jgi:alkylation response protein AidB-like acyl-CoA dehydrogenase
MPALSETEQLIVDTVHDFVDRQVKPFVREIEHANTYPELMIEQMKELGIFGLAIPEEHGGTEVSMPCYVHVTE